MRVWPINGYVLVEEKDQEKDVAVDSGKVKDIVTLPINDEGVRSVLEKQGNDIVVTSLRCPHGRCSDRVASLDISIGAGFDQKFAKCIVIVDRCPLGHPISVVIRRVFVARFPVGRIRAMG